MIKNLQLVCGDAVLGLTYVGGIAAYNERDFNCAVQSAHTISAQKDNGQNGNGFAVLLQAIILRLALFQAAQVMLCRCLHMRIRRIAGTNYGAITCIASSGVNSNHSIDASVAPQ